ncbi:MAG: 1-acyl-sn-glycerol-3-phosphate acyltransferase [Peptococcaceae bacterium]|nr:1-acyl-sn-glycerol-3-phosphate acyltransferase [Peptococcaceae bacterium]
MNKMCRKVVTEPFDSLKIPPKQNLFAIPFLWLYCWIVTRKGRLKIHKVRMKGLKPPFLVLATHHSFTDFYVTPLTLFPHRANYVSELEGFELFGEWVYRQVGCLGTRRFISDFALVKNIKKVIDRKGILVLYPEARYANVGTNSKLPDSVGKLAKMLKVPVVVLNMRGNYLQSPLWNLKIRREARMEATITQAYTAEELAGAPLADVQKNLQALLTYDEYAWQYEQKLAITYSKRAEGIEIALYMCPVCTSEFKMRTKNANLFCAHCGSQWHMTQYGKMELVKTSADYRALNRGVDFSHIPNWYEWERFQVEQEIEAGHYRLTQKVHIEALPNAVNFIDLGNGILTHDESGFSLTFTEYGEKEEKTLVFACESMNSIHTEYDYRRNGQCVVLSTQDNSYFLFPKEHGFNTTKIQFATEYLYERKTEKYIKFKNFLRTS